MDHIWTSLLNSGAHRSDRLVLFVQATLLQLSIAEGIRHGIPCGDIQQPTKYAVEVGNELGWKRSGAATWITRLIFVHAARHGAREDPLLPPGASVRAGCRGATLQPPRGSTAESGRPIKERLQAVPAMERSTPAGGMASMLSRRWRCPRRGNGWRSLCAPAVKWRIGRGQQELLVVICENGQDHEQDDKIPRFWTGRGDGVRSLRLGGGEADV
jgi:hypothetical protein